LRRGGGLSFLAVLLLAAGLGGCSVGVSPSTEPPVRSPIQVTGAWVRPPTAPGSPAAAYFTITNEAGETDALVGVSSSVAESIDIHETTMDSGGMTGMHPVERLEIPAGGSVTLEPGGYHLMLMGIPDGALIAGTTIVLDLEFERAGTIPVEVEVPQG
jgi:hypothetical protein